MIFYKKRDFLFFIISIFGLFLKAFIVFDTVI